MGESKDWGPRRCATLLTVALLHAALVAALLTPAAQRSVSHVDSVQLLLLPPRSAPSMVSDNPRPRPPGATAVKILPPVLASLEAGSAASQSEGPLSKSEGTGSAVDWAAEAHRALQAFEIRTHQPSNDVLISGSPAEERWWPRGRRRPGDEFKMPNGDWIVWVSSTCYQVAKSRSGKDAAGEAPPTVCVDEDRPARE